MRKKHSIRIFLVLVVSFLFYFSVGKLVHEAGFWSREEIYLAEKALLAIQGEPAKFENVGLIYPTLPFVLLFLPVFFGAHLEAGVLLSSAYGAAAVLAFSSLVKDKFDLFSVIFIFAHPVFLYVYSGGGSIGLFLILIFLFIYFHKRFLQSGERDIFSLFMSSIFLGLSVLARYDAVLFIFPVVFTLVFDENPWRLVSKPIVFLFPTLFILGGLVYINWMYKDDPFYFIHSLFLQTELFETGRITFWNFVFSLALFPSYVISIWAVRKRGKLLILVLSPLIVALTAVWILGTDLPLSYFCLLGGVGLIFLEEHKGLSKPIFLLASLAGLVAGFALTTNLMWGEEEAFTRFLENKNEREMFQQEREMAGYLSGLEDKVFFDDTYNYPIVFFHGDPEAFILPYGFEFDFYLSSPHLVSQYVLVSHPKDGKDSVSQNNDNIFFGKNPRWKLVKKVGKWKLFRSKDLMLRRDEG